LLEDPKGLGQQFVVARSGSSLSLHDADHGADFLATWKKQLSQYINTDFPTIREIFYTAYEASGFFEQLPAAKTAPTGGYIWRHLPDWSICFSLSEQKVYLSSLISETQLDMLEQWLSDESSAAPLPNHLPSIKHAQAINTDYKEAVERVREYIQAGDVFQANIARFWQQSFPPQCLGALYAKLRAVNPAPFSCYLNAGELTLASASPERLFSINKDGSVATRPIAGTRKRCEGEQDDVLSNELLLSEKERAEHIMLLDLERNDLGKVCVAGSIVVDECMVIEKYATVQHIVSNVSGKLDAQYDMLDVLEAMFPGGTITGCPKVRCMEIIHELEPRARGPYTGGVGYLAWDGTVDVNILIRTFWHEGNTLYWAAGAGIVADSIAKHEEIETEHKVAGLMRVFQ